MHIVVAGAGLVGLTAAAVLGRAGHEVEVVEQARDLRALHVEQQAVQASFTDPVPQALLSLFRHAPSPMGEPDVLPRS